MPGDGRDHEWREVDMYRADMGRSAPVMAGTVRGERRELVNGRDDVKRRQV
jgi:hypothetical protein